MFGKTALSILFLLLALSCAQPRYLEAPASNSGSSAPQEKIASCETAFRQIGLCLNWYWEKAPSPKEPGVLIFKTYRLNALDQTPVEVDLPGNAALVLWMPSMGHGSTPTQTWRLDEGTYRVQKVFFIMPGEWEMRFQSRSTEGIEDEAIVPLLI